MYERPDRVPILIDLPEPAAAGGRLIGAVEVGHVAQPAAAEEHLALAALLGGEGGHRRGRQDEPVQQRDGGEAQQVGEHHHGHPEVAEQHEGLAAVLLRRVEHAPADKAAGGEQRVQPVADLLIHRRGIAGLYQRVFQPAPRVEELRAAGPVLGHLVPDDALLSGAGVNDRAAELPKPRQHRRLPAQALKRVPGGVPGPAQRGAVVGVCRFPAQPVRQQLRLPPALGRQRVLLIVRLAVADDDELHLPAPFRSVDAR